jgi:hypothetical protein
METQQRISQWASETFGQPGSNLRVATRAGEELFELFKEISVEIHAEKAIVEAADVAIVLYRLCDRLGMTVDTSRVYRQDPDNPKLLIAEANAKMASVIVLLCHDDNGRMADYSLLQTYYCLGKFCEALGGDLHDAVQKKMAINRTRKWKLSGDGHGYHVRES